ncbi:MAG: hypothetical protein ACLU3I_15855 [Acutalibacteraceae bacterium]
MTTGDIVALAGGVGKKHGQPDVWNCATQKPSVARLDRSSPSSVYAPAIELGLITPATVYGRYAVFLYRHGDLAQELGLDLPRPRVRWRRLSMQSINTVPVKLVAEMTPEYSYSIRQGQDGPVHARFRRIRPRTAKSCSDVNLWRRSRSAV